MDEGELVRIELGLEGRFVHETADGIVGQEEPVELLAHELGGLAAQDDAPAPQMGLELVERGLDLPALVVESRKLPGRGGEEACTSPLIGRE